MKTYLLSIFSYRLLNEELDKIIINKDNIININYDESNIDDIIKECSYFSLLDEEKTIIVNNFKLNSSSKDLDKYLDNPNPNTTLILITSNIDKRNSLYKKIKDKGIVIEINELKINELTAKVNNYCRNNNIKIDYLALNKLLEYNLNNYDLILSDLDKIGISYENITLDIVNEYASVLVGDNIFNLCDAITSKDFNKANILLNKYIEEKGEIIPLITLLANQYRIIYATKELIESNDQIAKRLDVHPFRVKLAKDKSLLYGVDELKDILLKLCDLDKELKSLNVSEYTLFKKFLINIF